MFIPIPYKISGSKTWPYSAPSPMIRSTYVMLIVCPSFSYPSQICQHGFPVTMSQSVSSSTLWHIVVGSTAEQNPCCAKKLYNFICDLSPEHGGSFVAMRCLTVLPPVFIALTSHSSSIRFSLHSLRRAVQSLSPASC